MKLVFGQSLYQDEKMNTQCRPDRLWCKILSVFLAMIVLAACSTGGADVPSGDEVGEAIAQTKEATIEVLTHTPLPTATPVPPTNIPEPTPTS